MRKPKVLLVLMLALVSASCATLLKGRTDEITVISDPAGAKVSVNGDDKGVTPVTFTVPSKDDLTVHVAKDGYKPEDLNDPATTRWGWETFSFFSDVIPVFVDLGSGAAWGHDQLTLTSHLEPAAQSEPPTDSAKAAPSPAASPIANASPAAQPSPAPATSVAAASSPAAAAPTASAAQPAAGAISAK